MQANPPSTSTAPSPGRAGLWCFLTLLAVLAVLFYSSFAPGQVLFCNDGPLGVLMAQADTPWGGFLGYWVDLNWLGTAQPCAVPNLAQGLFILLGPALHGRTGPILFAKFHAPASLLILGLCAWLFFRQLRFRPWICLLGALAAMLNMDSFSYACWGLPTVSTAPGMVFLALAALHGADRGHPVLKAALAGMAVGMGVMQGFDVGAIFSLYVAAFTFFLVWIQPGATPGKVLKGIGRVALVAVFAVFLAAQALATLIETQIQGISGMQQDAKTREDRWNEATQWSLPKAETLRLIIPGLFGYRMDTPGGGNYWGAVGQDPAIPGLLQDYLSSPDEKVRSQAAQVLRSNVLWRHSGSGEYAGVLVMLLAVFALAQTLRKKDSPYSAVEKKCIWFWAGAAVISLLLAFGRHAPFYRLVYALPYFSTIRNPIKFLHPLHLSVVILFGYGLAALSRRYLETVTAKSNSVLEQLKRWWADGPVFERKWTLGAAAAIGAALLGWLLYASSRKDGIAYLQLVGFDEATAAAITRFSLAEVGWFILFLALSVLCVTVILSGALAGRRAKWAGLLLGLVLVVDLSRANAPWIVYYNYREKYAANPVVDFLRDHAYEKRVTAPPYLVQGQFAFFQQLYHTDWMQHLFQYYDVQSLDIVQMPRQPQDYSEFMLKTFSPTNLARQGRLWQLTSTRYLLGLAGYLDSLNQSFDPVQRRFRVHTLFTFTQASDGQITTVVNTNGPFALIENGAALPRASLFTRWQVITNNEEVITNNGVVSTNDQKTLRLLADPAFDPAQTVLVADALPALPAPTATNAAAQKAGWVSFTHYEPKCVQFSAQAELPSVLLLNDRYDPNWKVWVDGRPEKLLRCNYLMRGVFLQPGKHTVEFRFQPPVTTLYVSLAALLLGFVFCGVLAFAPGRADEAKLVPDANPKSKT